MSVPKEAIQSKRPDRAKEAAAPAPAPPTVRSHTLTGDFRTHERFHSRYLNNERTVLVYLPPGYHDDDVTRYPVLYLQDGQNLFDDATSFSQEWRVDETAQELIEAGEIRPLIIVGIYNAEEHRIQEYTPTEDARHKEGGKANLYGRMLVEELKPFIDRHYRTLPGAANTGLGGSSLGGLVTMHLGLRYPTVFSNLVVMSPSVWWDHRAIVREVEALPGRLPLHIWLDCGTEEGPTVVSDTRLLRDALVAKGWRVGDDLQYFEAVGAGHDEASWAARTGLMLRFLFPERRTLLGRTLRAARRFSSRVRRFGR